MKKIIFVLLCIFVCTTVKAGIVFESVSPANKSAIDSFEFTLKFDISEAKSQLPDIADQLGVGCSGTSKKCAQLYVGDPETGELISSALSKAVTGASDSFVIGGEFNFSFADVKPVDGVTYTVVINNTFGVFAKGATKNVGATYNYSDGFVFTFIGKGDSEQFQFVSSSIQGETKFEQIEKIKLTFNAPILISDNATASIFEGETVAANAVLFEVDPENENTAVISFNNVPLYKNTDYQFICEAGSIQMKSDNAQSNEDICILLQGDTFKPFKVVELTPNETYNGILTSASVKFELPENSEILETYAATTQVYPATVYKISGNERIEVASLSGKPLPTADGIIWTLDCEILPETEYIIIVPENSIKAYTRDATSISGYRLVSDMRNSEIVYAFTTPSIENCNLANLEFTSPYKSDIHGYNHVEIPNNSKVDFIPILYMDLKDRYYLYNGSSFELLSNPNFTTASLYKISEGGERIKIKDFDLSTMIFYSAESRYKSAVLSVNSRLYEGETYQIVIPAGAFTVDSKPLQSFISSEEIVLTYEGTSDSNLSLTCASLRDGERMSSISSVTFLSDQELSLVRSWDTIALQTSDGNDVKTSSYTVAPVSYMIKQDTGHSLEQIFTRIMVDFSDPRTMTPFYLPESADEYQIVIPAGTFCLANDPDITNDEIVVNIKRVPESGLPEYVTLTSVVNAHASTVLPIEKGLKAKLQLTPSEDWAIEKVVFNGKDVTDNIGEDGTYETPVVRIDSRMEIHLVYNGELFFENATGVAEIPDMQVRAFSEGEFIIVEGVSSGDIVTVYSMAGVSLGTHTATDDMVKITAPKGNIYIVSITPANGNKKAAVKINH